MEGEEEKQRGERMRGQGRVQRREKRGQWGW